MIRSTAADGVREIVIDRPDRANALTPTGLVELEDAVADAGEPVVYLHGAGETFCAGADLDVVADLQDPAEFARQGQRVTDAIAAAESVVVAGVDGAARGGGVELTLACDLRVATPDATLAESGIEHGLFGAWGGTVRLPEVVSQGDALDLALSGRVIDADEALRMGLVSRVVEDPHTVATAIAENDQGALSVIKRLVRADGGQKARLASEAEAFADLVSARQTDGDRTESN